MKKLILFIFASVFLCTNIYAKMKFSKYELESWADSGMFDKESLKISQLRLFAERSIEDYIKTTGINTPSEAKMWKDAGLTSTAIKNLRANGITPKIAKSWMGKNLSLEKIGSTFTNNIKPIMKIVKQECKDFNGDKECFIIKAIDTCSIVNDKLLVSSLNRQYFFLLDFNGERLKNNLVLDEYALLNYENTIIYGIGYSNRNEIVNMNKGQMRINIIDVLVHPLKIYDEKETYNDSILSVDNLKGQGRQDEAPSIGQKIKGGVFVYREYVERYWNDWIAYLLMDKNLLEKVGQAHLTLIGEGKTVAFVGNISINCENGKFLWESGSDDSIMFSNEKEINSVVPTQVIKNTTQLFCNADNNIAYNDIIISDEYYGAGINMKDYTIRGDGEECSITYDVSDNTLIGSTCISLTNSKGIKIHCTKNKKICKTEEEIADKISK